MALWTLPFGVSATASADTTLTLGAQRAVYDGDGRNFGTLDIQHPLPVGIGWGYYLHAETDRNYTGGVSYYGKYGRYSLEGSSVSGESAVRASVAGGIGLVAGHAFIAPPIEQSFAVVEVGEQRGVRVLQENFEAGVTGADGTLVLSRLPSDTPVTVAIDPLSVPLDLAIGETEKKLVTLGRTGVLIRFEARKERSALVRIVTPDGKPLPEGAAVRVKGRTEAFPVAMGGEAFLTDLADEQDIEVMHRGRGCIIALHLDRASPPVADLGPFVCALEPLAGKAP
jgi:outer membrane usher protein